MTPQKTRRGDAASIAAGKAVALQAFQGLMRQAGLVAPLSAPLQPRSPSPQTRERRARAAARAVARQTWLGVLGEAGLDALSLMRTSGVDVDTDSLSDMPHDVLCHVLATFSPIELCRARAVSRTWHASATCDALWSPLFRQRFGAPPPPLTLAQALRLPAFQQFRRRVDVESRWLSGQHERWPQHVSGSGRPVQLRDAALDGELLVGATRGSELLAWALRGDRPTSTSKGGGWRGAAAAARRFELGEQPSVVALASSVCGSGAASDRARAVLVGTRGAPVLLWSDADALLRPGHVPTWGRIDLLETCGGRGGSGGGGSGGGGSGGVEEAPAAWRGPSQRGSAGVRQLSGSGSLAACVVHGCATARVCSLERGEVLARVTATEPASRDALATAHLQGQLLWTGSECGVLRLWDLRAPARASGVHGRSCVGIVRHAEGCSRLVATGQDLVSAAAAFYPSPRCIAARHWDTRKMECVRLYCAAGHGTPSALQFDTEKLLLGSNGMLAAPGAPLAGDHADAALSSIGTGRSLAVFMLRDERPVLRPVALMGEPGSTQWAHFNEYGLMASGQHLNLWSFR